MTFWRRWRPGGSNDAASTRATTTPDADSGLSGSSSGPAGARRDERWVGYVDRLEGDVVVGWCCDMANPDHSPAIEAVSQGGKRAVTIANLFRQDVKDAGFGSGTYGFRVDLAPFKLQNETVTLRFLDSKVPIGREPISLDPLRMILSHTYPGSFLHVMRQLAVELREAHADMTADASGAREDHRPSVSQTSALRRSAQGSS